jgi:hypothetical protein
MFFSEAKNQTTFDSAWGPRFQAMAGRLALVMVG